MKKRDLRNWKNIEELQGLLFFVQRVDEMLFYYTLDTYKPPIYNIVLLLREYFSVMNKIDNGILKDKNEIAIIDEIIWTLKRDDVAKEVIGDFAVDDFIQNYGSYGKDKKKRTLNLFLNKIDNKEYLDRIRNYLKKSIMEDKKSDIEKYSILYIRELTVIGYDARYIYKCLNNVFYKKIISKNDCIEDFFACFSLEGRMYSVLFSVNEEMASLCEKMHNKSMLNYVKVLNRNEVPKEIGVKEGFKVVSIEEINSLDEYAAFEMGKTLFKLLNNYFTFFRSIDNELESGGYVKSDEGKIEFIKENVSGINRTRRIQSSEKTYASTTGLLDIATANYENLYKMSRIMEIHNTAIVTKSQSNVLLSLWSILELLLEENETDNKHSRITNIIDMIIPSLVNSYIERIVLDLYEDVKLFGKEEIEMILGNVTEAGDEFEKFFAFLVLEKYESLRKEYYNKLHDYPLLRNRIFSLNKELSDNKKTQSKINTHEQKIKWHLQRIYRTRNCIIHDGEDVPNIDELVENLFAYINIFCDRIIRSIGSQSGIYTVSNAILDEELKYKLYRDKLEKENINEKNYLRFLHHD